MCSTGDWKIGCPCHWGTTEVSCPWDQEGWAAGRCRCDQSGLILPALNAWRVSAACQCHPKIPWCGFQACLQTPLKKKKLGANNQHYRNIPARNKYCFNLQKLPVHTHTDTHSGTPRHSHWALVCPVQLRIFCDLWSSTQNEFPAFYRTSLAGKLDKLPEYACYFGGEELLGRSGNFQDNDSHPAALSLSRLFQTMRFWDLNSCPGSFSILVTALGPSASGAALPLSLSLSWCRFPGAVLFSRCSPCAGCQRAPPYPAARWPWAGVRTSSGLCALRTQLPHCFWDQFLGAFHGKQWGFSIHSTGKSQGSQRRKVLCQQTTHKSYWYLRSSRTAGVSYQIEHVEVKWWIRVKGLIC